MSILSFNDCAYVKVDTTVAAYPKVVDAADSPREPSRSTALKGDVYPSTSSLGYAGAAFR